MNHPELNGLESQVISKHQSRKDYATPLREILDNMCNTDNPITQSVYKDIIENRFHRLQTQLKGIKNEG